MKMYRQSIYVLLACSVLTGCIGNDFVFDEVDPVLRITTSIDTMQINTTLQFEQMYLNNIGVEESVNATWVSSDESVIAISTDGLAEALQEGSSVIATEYHTADGMLRDEITVYVGQTASTGGASASGVIQTTSSYLLEGDFTIQETENGIRIEIAENYRASTALPGLYVYLTNNKNTTANALEIGAVQVFSGAHQYDIPNVKVSDYSHILYFCKPFNVKVGDGEIR